MTFGKFFILFDKFKGKKCFLIENGTQTKVKAVCQSHSHVTSSKNTSFVKFSCNHRKFCFVRASIPDFKRFFFILKIMLRKKRKFMYYINVQKPRWSSMCIQKSVQHVSLSGNQFRITSLFCLLLYVCERERELRQECQKLVKV